MLTIRNAQIAALNRSIIADFISDLEVHLSETYPEKCKEGTSESRRNWIDSKLQEALHFEIIVEDDVAEYIELVFCHPELAQTPKPAWLIDVLNWPGRSPERKFKLIREHLDSVEAK